MVLLGDPYQVHLGQVHVIFRIQANDLGEPSPSKEWTFIPTQTKPLKLNIFVFMTNKYHS